MKTLVSYAYFESPSSIYNFTFFVKNAIKESENVDYVIVINGYTCNVEIPTFSNVKIIKRDNVGFDFGAHNAAIKDKENDYDYYIFLNSGVIGPITNSRLDNWINIFTAKITNDIKLVGTTIVCLPAHDCGKLGPKVEGFFFLTDKVGLKCLLEEKTIFQDHPNKYSAIVFGEYGLSNCILKHGYNIDCMLTKYQGIDWRKEENWDKNNFRHPSRKNSYYGESIDPFEVIFHKWFWHGEPTVNFEIIDNFVKQNKFAMIDP